ncbi:hypothetical protein J41TS12_37260 [Paenibacillus antibioticophila]|uniref:Uncharacterized protein n=1 Tax=Paenibacillus antibioticophila TaxID=1274374 RepID=A0A919XXW3_9BACL|nr:hypothetical protein [Paenibacillus antibioticophila]GIO38865.1 hypothetical protein J41TS12_37260 [Paenibacillus antibioticophila]
MRTRDWTEAEDIITVSLLFEWRRMLAAAPHGKKREMQDRFCQNIINVRPEFEDRTADAVRQHFLQFDRITLKDINYDKLHVKHKMFFAIHTGLEKINE